MRETVLRYLVEERQPPADKATCLTVEGVEKHEATSLGEAIAEGRTLYAGEQCQLDAPDIGSIRHLPSGREALLHGLYSLKWIDERTALLVAGWYGASLYGESCDYRVKQIGGDWKVTAVEDCVVS